MPTDHLCVMIHNMMQAMSRLFFAWTHRCMRAVIACGVVSCLAVSFAHADTIDDISLEKGQDGKLHINVNVSGQAQSVSPNEADSEGVYTLGLNAKSSDRVKATPLVMDATGKHIARLNVENGKVSVVVPGVRSDEVRVHMRSSSGSITPSSQTILSSTPAPTWDSKASLETTPNWLGGDPWMTPSVPEVADNTESTPKRWTAKRSKWKRTHTAWRPSKHSSTAVKSNAKAIQAPASPDLAMAEPPIENELETMNLPLNLAKQSDEGHTFESETPQGETAWIEPNFIENPLSVEAFEPLPPLEVMLAPEEAYALYLELPWDNEDWLNTRVLNALDSQEKELNASLWMLYLSIGGMCLAVCIGLAFKLNPTLAMHLQDSQARLRDRLSRGGFTSHAQSIETPPEERPFASWLTQEEETLDAEAMAEEDYPTLDDDLHAMPENTAHLWNPPALPEPVAMSESAKVLEVPTLQNQALPEATSEATQVSRVATLKPPTYFAFRHQQRINQNSFQKTPIQSVLKLPMQAKKPLQRNATPAPLSRLNRLHFGA